MSVCRVWLFLIVSVDTNIQVHGLYLIMCFYVYNNKKKLKHDISVSYFILYSWYFLDKLYVYILNTIQCYSMPWWLQFQLLQCFDLCYSNLLALETTLVDILHTIMLPLHCMHVRILSI